MRATMRAVFAFLLVLSAFASGLSSLAGAFQTKPVVVAKDEAGRPTKTSEIDSSGNLVIKEFKYDKNGKVEEDSETGYRPGTTDADKPKWKKTRKFDPVTGKQTEQVDEINLFDVAGNYTGSYRTTITFEDGKPKDVKAEKKKADGEYHKIAYSIAAPTLIAAGEPYSATIVEAGPDGVKPLDEGDTVVVSGVVVPVHKGGRVSIPAPSIPVGLVDIAFDVFTGPDRREPTGICRHHVLELPRTPGVDPAIDSGSSVLHSGGLLHISGSGLDGLKNPVLERSDGSKTSLRELGGSSYERVYGTDNVIALKTDVYRFVAEGPDGKRIECPNTIKRPDLKVEVPPLRIVGQKGDVTLTCDVDCTVDIVGGDEFIQLSRRTVSLMSGEPVRVPFVAKRVGMYDLTFPIHAKGEYDDNPEAPPANVDQKPPQVLYDPGRNHTIVKVPVDLRGEDGKPVSTGVDGVVVTPGGIQTGHCETDKKGHGDLLFDIIGHIDVENIVAQVANVFGHHAVKPRPVEKGHIKGITLTNDDDNDVYYVVYRPGTRGQPRQELVRTGKVAPGGMVILKGDFGPDVRIAALRKPDDDTTGLISDHGFSSGNKPEQHIHTHNEGLRDVVIETAQNEEEIDPKKGDPPVLPKPTTPPDKPVEPPQPPIKPDKPTVYFPTSDFKGFGLKLEYKLDWGMYPDAPPIIYGHNTAPPELKDFYDGYFEPIQSVYQDDDKFPDFETKQLTKLGPHSWRAELDMVSEKSTLITGIRTGKDGEEAHSWARIYGISHGTEEVAVHWRFTLKQSGAGKVVYEESESNNKVWWKGPGTQAHIIDVRTDAFEGLPRELDAYRAFKMQPGPYEIVGELLTPDGTPTGYEVSVVGNCVSTAAPPIYLVPLGIQHHGEASSAAALNRALDNVSRAGYLQQELAFWGPSFLPIRDGGLNVFVVPPMVFSLPPLKKGDWWSDDEKADPKVDEGKIISGLMVTMSMWAMLGGNGKVVGIVNSYDYDLTMHKSEDSAAFTPTEKAILLQRDFYWTSVVLHEMTHAEPFLWSTTRMQNLFGFDYHNNANGERGDGIRIYPGGLFRKRRYHVDGIMASVPSSNDTLYKWIEQGTYWWLLRKFQGTPDPAVLTVSGVLWVDGAKKGAGFAPFFTGPGIFDEVDKDGSFFVLVQDAAGHALGKYRFDAEAKKPQCMTPFAVRVPTFPNMAQVSIVDALDGKVLATQKLSASAPTLSAALKGVSSTLNPGDKFTVSWRATTSNGEKPLAIVLFSPDGEAWFPVASYSDGASAEVTAIGNLTHPKVKVVVTDGTRSSETILDVKPGP